MHLRPSVYVRGTSQSVSVITSVDHRKKFCRYRDRFRIRFNDLILRRCAESHCRQGQCDDRAEPAQGCSHGTFVYRGSASERKSIVSCVAAALLSISERRVPDLYPPFYPPMENFRRALSASAITRSSQFTRR